MVADYYAVLEIPKDADTTTITRAYRKRALKTHPDRGGNESEFKIIAEAYEVLSDRRKRAAYDQRESPQRQQQYDPFGFSTPSTGGGSSFSTNFGHRYTMDARDLFDRMFSDLSRFGTSDMRSDPFLSPHFATGPSVFDSVFGPGGQSFSLGNGTSRSASPGVTSRINNKSGHTNCSFSTSFGSSSHYSRSNNPAQTQSYTKSTRIVNGEKQEYVQKIDTQGNSSVEITSSDGSVQHFLNGKQVDNGERKLPPASAQTGTRARPVVIE